MQKEESRAIPADFNYRALSGLSNELVQKLETIRPVNLGQAGRIEGITPAALTLILAHLRRLAVRGGGAAKNLAQVSRETILRLSIYHALLNKWQAKTNLIAPGTLPDYWTRHVADSLQLYALIRKSPGALPHYWIDIGSGGGFPGLVLACLFAAESTTDQVFSIVLVESIQKKCSFLRRVISECSINARFDIAQVECNRIESATERFANAELVTARALASLEKLLEFTGKFLQAEQGISRRALFHKGRDYRREIQESRGKWDFDLLVHPSRIDPESVILEISNVSLHGR
ncbi:unnamed protein product [Cyprideis torosa]|uniref:Uncharacterized protein n=1 Tax=Cyprideis torosa TaxID=163714 RepID=A0A7R8X0Q5_9CRUS|nr:unnamed protein product [Cyprideis torosa]CAG0909943.1 unnamed protein product [Cyprideis torosa]